MPVPKPHDNESQDDFIDRCMGDDMMNDEFPENDQRSVVCFSTWREREKARGDIFRKSFKGATLKEDKPGLFVARIATLNVVDSDNDVTLPGAFPEGKQILLSCYQHGSWSGGLPVGKAILHEAGNEMLIEGEFNLKTNAGREHYETVKFAPDLQEWSYGFRVQECSTNVEWEGRPVSRILKKLDVIEASPVLRGAGVNTAVLAIKNEGLPYSDHVEAALAAVRNVVERTKALAALRGKEGRKMSGANMDRMRMLIDDMNGMMQEMRGMVAMMESEDGKALAGVVMRMIERQMKLRGN